MSRKGRPPHALRNKKLREAEKDLAFALVALQDGQLSKALLNVAVATVRLSGAMTISEMDVVVEETERLVARSAVRSETPGLPEIPDLA